MHIKEKRLTLVWQTNYYWTVNLILTMWLCVKLKLYLVLDQASGIMVQVFSNDPGDRGSIPSQVILKTQKMVHNAALLNTQHYKVPIKGKVEQSRERSTALPYTSV